MPLIQSNYTPPLRIFRNGDIATIYAAMCRKVTTIQQTRERIDLVDGDFIDLDWSYSFKKSNQLVIICHGLEGHAQRPYIMGAAKLFNQHGYDCCAINYRGCSGEINKKFTAYHSGLISSLYIYSCQFDVQALRYSHNIQSFRNNLNLLWQFLY